MAFLSSAIQTHPARCRASIAFADSRSHGLMLHYRRSDFDLRLRWLDRVLRNGRFGRIGQPDVSRSRAVPNSSRAVYLSLTADGRRLVYKGLGPNELWSRDESPSPKAFGRG